MRFVKAPRDGNAESGLTGGVDIQVTETTVDRAGNVVLLFDSGGALLAEYAATSAGVDAALAAQAADDVIWCPPVEIDGDHTLTAGGYLEGCGTRTTFTGLITHAAGSHLANCQIVRDGDEAGGLVGVLGPDSGTGYLRDVFVSVTNSGGPAVGVKTRGGEVAIHDGSVWATATAVDADAYGVYTDDEGTARVMNVHVKATAEVGEGWALVRSATGGDGFADGCVLEYTTGAVLEEE